MVFCKFFLQGSCRYGSSCRFEHSYNSKYSYHSSSQNQVAPTQPQQVTDEQLVNQVQTDVQAVLKGGQWILSSYAPFKEKPAFPGISDLSPEEARLFIYEARANNTLDQAVAFMNNVTVDARRKYEQLLQPTPAILNTLRSLYKGEVGTPSPFGVQSQNSAFGVQPQNSAPFGSSFSTQQQTQASIFGTQPQNQSVFGQKQNDTARSIFAQANQNVQQQNPASVFATSPFSQPFAAQPQTAQNHSVFGSPPQNQSPFSQNQTPFGQNQSPFGAQNDQAKSIFAQANQNVFNNAPQQQNPSNAFASSPFSLPADPFGRKQTQFTSAQSTESNGIYSNVEDLSESDLEAFSSNEFKLGFIPEIPPPQSYCI